MAGAAGEGIILNGFPDAISVSRFKVKQKKKKKRGLADNYNATMQFTLLNVGGREEKQRVAWCKERWRIHLLYKSGSCAQRGDGGQKEGHGVSVPCDLSWVRR